MITTSDKSIIKTAVPISELHSTAATSWPGGHTRGPGLDPRRSSPDHSSLSSSVKRPEHNSQRRRSTSAHQDQTEQQNHLRYLIAKTASIPRLNDQGRHGSSHHQPHGRYRSRAANDIMNRYDERNHPNSVQQRTSSEPSISSAIRHNQHRNHYLERARPKSTGLDLEMDSLNRPNSHYYDFDSLDIDDLEYDSSEDGYEHGKASDDDDDDDGGGGGGVDDVVDDADDDDLDLGASSDIDVVREEANDAHEDGSDDEDDQAFGANSSQSVMHSDNDSDNSEAHQIGASSNRHIGRKYRGGGRAKILYSYLNPATATEGLPLGGIGEDSGRNLNATEENHQVTRNDLRSESSDGQPLGGPNWITGHDDELLSGSDDVVTVSVSNKRELSSGSNGQLGQHKGKSIQPLAPYQSPVVVSVSDNSFVSASPIAMGSDVELGFENLNQKRLGEATVRYSHIIASPKNELSRHGKKHWHESHIQMIQEDPDELRKGNINSAIIAILFGIGATGMLIMIVSVKMRSIRERVAYKGRRRSLVPDTDFLINTIPI